MKLKQLLIYSVILLSGLVAGFYLNAFLSTKSPKLNGKLPELIKDTSLNKYAFDSKSWTDIKPGKLRIVNSLKTEKEYESFQFEFEFNPNMDGKTVKKTSGQINIPVSKQKDVKNDYPVILMFRGYINQVGYKTGDGTRNASVYFAKNGFITIAPDFLGYGDSDKESGDIFETRFQTYVTAVQLLRTIEKLRSDPTSRASVSKIKDMISNESRIFIWGHSNGGQIAITTLELTKAEYPTVLWAPVSKPFPYSVLFYTDQSDDKGKLIRHELADFEASYDVEKYSLSNYTSNINTAIQLHQGTADDAVPVAWSDDFVKKLKSEKKDINYFKYPGTDHNMRPEWDNIVVKNVEFYNSYLTR